MANDHERTGDKGVGDENVLYLSWWLHNCKGLSKLIEIYTQKLSLGVSPGSLVVKTPPFHCRSLRLHPWSGILILACLM